MNSTSAAAGSPNATENLKRLPILIALVIGAFFSILNETLLNVAYVRLMEDFQVAYTTVQWLSTSYMLVVGILVPVSALLIGWLTTRQMFIGALSLFTLGTLVCALSPDFSILLGGRVIQALGTGLMLPVMMNTILVLYPPENRGAAMGSIGLVIMFAPAIGPTLSGLILESLDWRWLFWLVLPFAALSILIAWIYMRNVTDVTKPRIDVLSILLSTVAFGGIVYGFSTLGKPDKGWESPEVYLTVISGIVCLLLFVLVQLRSKEPMLDFRVFRTPMFSLATILIIIVMMSLFSTLLLLPILMQQGMLMTAFAAGLVLLPGGILNGFLSPVTGKLFDKFGPRALVIPGAALLVLVMWLFTRIDLETSKSMIILLHCLMSISLSMIIMPAQTNGLNGLSRSHYPHGTAINNTLQQVSGALGIAIFFGIMTSGQNRFLEEAGHSAGTPLDVTNPLFAPSLSAGVSESFKFGLIFAVIALVVALFIRKSEVPKS
ncbi:DHA2 family efflux MFS transporter permease subunit [Paenibacillus sp. J5C_2022]|uniref:MDR family MFS transporter n=1 Tax=Paenibacillus sp. J5C2022 TaxID=2977129 RepID=UPI0021D350A4|nr:MDR family MFS transporter [Paenibacillus sp. J5C2022]MCU6708471.1 DHA2 family efflux MFS transporter permease subunit [Paenibacillus sp. J5C2022]